MSFPVLFLYLAFPAADHRFVYDLILNRFIIALNNTYSYQKS